MKLFRPLSRIHGDKNETFKKYYYFKSGVASSNYIFSIASIRINLYWALDVSVIENFYSIVPDYV